MKKQSTLFAFKFRGKREKDKADSDSTVPAKSTDKADKVTVVQVGRCK